MLKHTTFEMLKHTTKIYIELTSLWSANLDLDNLYNQMDPSEGVGCP